MLAKGRALAMLPGWARSRARARPARLRSSEAVGYPRSHSAKLECIWQQTPGS